MLFFSLWQKQACDQKITGSIPSAGSIHPGLESEYTAFAPWPVNETGRTGQPSQPTGVNVSVKQGCSCLLETHPCINKGQI